MPGCRQTTRLSIDVADDFQSSLKLIDEHLRTAAASIMSAFDRMTYRMLIDTLKSEDPAAVKDAIDQLVKEKRMVAVAPLYLVSVAHPVPWVKEQAKKGLAKLVPAEKLNRLTDSQDIKGSVQKLIEEYGHYKS